VVRNDRVLVPRGDTMIRVGDEVLVLVTTDAEEDVRRILTGA
jgi:trk/ktr system potassium uptake protein